MYVPCLASCLDTPPSALFPQAPIVVVAAVVIVVVLGLSGKGFRSRFSSWSNHAALAAGASVGSQPTVLTAEQLAGTSTPASGRHIYGDF